MSEGRQTPPMPELPIHQQNEEGGDGTRVPCQVL